MGLLTYQHISDHSASITINQSINQYSSVRRVDRMQPQTIKVYENRMKHTLFFWPMSEPLGLRYVFLVEFLGIIFKSLPFLY